MDSSPPDRVRDPFSNLYRGNCTERATNRNSTCKRLPQGRQRWRDAAAPSHFSVHFFFERSNIHRVRNHTARNRSHALHDSHLETTVLPIGTNWTFECLNTKSKSKTVLDSTPDWKYCPLRYYQERSGVPTLNKANLSSSVYKTQVIVPES